MANYNVLGYETSIGNKYLLIFDHVGPKSYLNIGTSSHAGDIINASDFAKGGFDWVNLISFGGGQLIFTQSGNYVIKMWTATSTTNTSVSYPIGSANVGGEPFPKVVLQWFTTGSAFGTISTEVADTTDLSGESIRMIAIAV